MRSYRRFKVQIWAFGSMHAIYDCNQVPSYLASRGNSLCVVAIAEEVVVEPAAAAELLSLLANGCSRVVSLLPAGTCMWVGGRRRRKRQRWWRERRQRWRQLTMSAFPGPRR